MKLYISADQACMKETMHSYENLSTLFRTFKTMFDFKRRFITIMRPGFTTNACYSELKKTKPVPSAGKVTFMKPNRYYLSMRYYLFPQQL